SGWNAQTGDDYTVYATVVDGALLENEIKDHAARMGELKITGDDLKRELPRITRELRNMYGGIPAIAAANLARARVRPVPFDGRKGGLGEQLKALSAEQLQSRWQEYYKPSNATLVVVGPASADDLRRWIGEGFGKLPSGKRVAAPPPARLTKRADDDGNIPS